MIRLAITGACGRMGATILKAAAADPAFLVTHIIEIATHPLVGTTVDVPGTTVSLPLEDSLGRVMDDVDVVIDFTSPEASLFNFRMSAEKGKAIVIGTTGIPASMLSEMRDLPGARAVVSPNMSIGVNVLFALVEKAASVLCAGYDTEIVEMHHRWKKDSPSGTAMRLSQIVKATNRARKWIEVTGRHGMVGERKADEIGVSSLRGGDVVGEHTVHFAGLGERLELTHRAYSRENFAHGALEAARWIAGRASGVYDMADVLGLRTKA